MTCALFKRKLTSQIFELLSAILCLWSIWLNTRRRTAGWPIGLASVMLAAWVYFHAGLMAECGLQFFYLISGIYGWWQWTRAEDKDQNHTVSAHSITGKEAIIGVLIAAVISSLIWLVLKKIPGANNPLPDAFLTGFSLLAQVWLARRRLENWLLWMLINLGSVILYMQRELWFFSLLYALLLLLAIRGYLGWRKSMKEC